MGKQSFSAKRGNLWQFDPKDLVVIGIDTDDGPEHELYDERAKLPLEEPTVLNYMAIGVKQSVTIRKGPKGKPEVVDGRRRVLHAREANKRLKKAGDPEIRVPAVLEHGSEVHMGLTAIALNELRLEDDTLTKANKAVRLLNRNGNDYEAVANAFGVSVTAIKNWVKLIELSPKVKKAISEGQISASAASQLHGLDKEAQAHKLKKLTTGAKKKGQRRPTMKSAKKETGKKTVPGKRVLLKLITDEELSKSLDDGLIHGIRLALGDHIPDENTKLGQLLVKAGYVY